MDTLNMEKRVKNYWTKRAHDFASVRKNELHNDMGRRWLEEINSHLSADRNLDILDVGTGTGFFAILLSGAGHRLKGIDLTEAMLEEAKETARQSGSTAQFEQMDAQTLAYPDHSFDVVISRNLTWTLPEPEQAYREWFRVLRPGGILLNYDARYAVNVRSHSTQNRHVQPDSPYGHVGMTNDLQQENDEITLAMDRDRKRPDWDMQILREIGFKNCQADTGLGQRILGEFDLVDAPMFGISARVPGRE